LKQRNNLIDYLRGLAIFLVIWGHSIQFLSTTSFNALADTVFIVIYSWHMPCFIGMAGWLFFPSQKNKSFGSIVSSKTKQILVPLMIWSGIRLLADGSESMEHGNFSFLTAGKYLSFVTTALWFLWSAYLCSLINAVISKFTSDKPWIYALATLLILLLPNTQSFYMVKYMVPYFFAGYLYNKYGAYLRHFVEPAFYVSMLMFPLLLLKWNSYAYIYISGPAFDLLGPPSGVAIIIYRYALGFFGSIIFFVIAEKYLFPFAQKGINKLGQQTLGIYIIGGFIAIYLLRRLHVSAEPIWLYDYVITPLVSVGVTAVSYWATILLSKSAILNQYLLGGRSANSIAGK
jgi:fucose 4-O-acetylase-like acetyltransferase